MGVSGISSVPGGAPGDLPQQPSDDPDASASGVPDDTSELVDAGPPDDSEDDGPPDPEPQPSADDAAPDLPAEEEEQPPSEAPVDVPAAADPAPEPPAAPPAEPATEPAEPSPPAEPAAPADLTTAEPDEPADLTTAEADEPADLGTAESVAPAEPATAEPAAPELDQAAPADAPPAAEPAAPEVDEAAPVDAPPAADPVEPPAVEPPVVERPFVEPPEAEERPWPTPYPPAEPPAGPAQPLPAPTRRPRPGPSAPAAAPPPAAPVDPAAALPGQPPAPRPRPTPPAGPTRAATRASAKAAGTRKGQRTGRAAAAQGTRGASASAARPARRRRRWPVVLAALVAVALLAAGAVWRLDLLGDPTDGPVAEQVPDAVLPELTQPTPALAELPPGAPAPDPAVLSGVLGPLLAAPALGTGLSARVVDVDSGTVLFDLAGTEPGTPASTAKLLTGVAVLTTLDPESTLTTRVVAGTAPGEVVLLGGGDPTLSTTDPSRSYPGAATVADLAAQVQAQLGGTPVSRVVVDASLFSGPLTAPGWQPDDAPSTYAAPVTAAAVDGARVSPTGSQRSGQPGTDAGAALAAALGAPTADVSLGGAPAGARTLGTVESAPVQRLLEQALTESDNLLSESLARHVALARGLPATFAGAAQAVGDAVAEAGLDTTGLTLVDASGLSDLDRIPARLLVDAVRGASDGTVPEAAGLAAGLPIAGYTGTLTERTVDGAVPGAVRAKTGTLLAVHDLAGTVVTAEGRLLAFAVLADGTAGSPAATETALDVVAATLAGCGCR